MIHDIATPRFGYPVCPWYRVFAWLPVRTWDGRWVWLDSVERRLIQPHDHIDFLHRSWFQYRVAP